MKKEGLGIDTVDDSDTAKIDAQVITPKTALDRLKRLRDKPSVSPRNLIESISPRSAIRMNKSPRNGGTPTGADRLKQIEMQKRRTSLLRSNTPKN